MVWISYNMNTKRVQSERVETPTYHYNNTPAINPNREADSPGQRWLKSS